MSHIVHTFARRIPRLESRSCPARSRFALSPGARDRLPPRVARALPMRGVRPPRARDGRRRRLPGVLGRAPPPRPRRRVSALRAPRRRHALRGLPPGPASARADRRVRPVRGRPEDPRRRLQVPRLRPPRPALRSAPRRDGARDAPRGGRRRARSRALDAPPQPRARLRPGRLLAESAGRSLALPSRRLLARTRDTLPQSNCPPHAAARTSTERSPRRAPRRVASSSSSTTSRPRARPCLPRRARSRSRAPPRSAGLVLARTPETGPMTALFDRLVVSTLPLVPRALVKLAWPRGTWRVRLSTTRSPPCVRSLRRAQWRRSTFSGRA